MPTITQLEYLLAVQRAGHFGRAAKLCRVSQPTLSTQVQKVEEELGVTVFDRGSRPVEPTPEGRALLLHASEVVAAHERLVWTARGQTRALTGPFAVGIIPTLAPYVLPWFLLRFAGAHPRLQVSILERSTDELVEGLLAQRLDAAVLATPLEERAIRERVLFYDPFYLYAHAADPLLREREIDPRGLAAAKLWLLEDGHCVRTQVVRFCGLRGTHAHLRNVTFAAGSFETLRNLIDAAGGYSLFPETFVRGLPKKAREGQVRPFGPVTPTREVSLVHFHKSWKTDALDALEAALRATVPRALRQVAADGEILPVR